MACLGIASAAMSAAQGSVDSAKGSYEGDLANLRGLNPSSFANRSAFESAKAIALQSVATSQAAYTSALGGLKSAASALAPTDGVDIDSISTLTDAAHLSIMATSMAAAIAAVAAAAPFGIPVPPLPPLPGAVSAATDLMKGLQC